MFNFPSDPGEASAFVWQVSLVLGLVVAVVVTLLLWVIHRTARSIDMTASKIWDTGQRVANNTVHIPILYRINSVAEKILASALDINKGAEAIKTHAKGCPGCPHCMWDHAS